MQRIRKYIIIPGNKLKKRSNLKNKPISEEMTKTVRKDFKDEISLRRLDCKYLKFREI